MKIMYKKIEETEVDDVFSFFQILKEEKAQVSFIDVSDRNEILQWLKNQLYMVYVIKEGNVIIGVLRGKRGRGNESHSVVISIAIHPNFRRMQLGKNLMQYALKKFKEEGISLARAYVYSSNKPSINTLLSCGFTISGCIYRDHLDEASGDYIDDIIFHKLL